MYSRHQRRKKKKSSIRQINELLAANKKLQETGKTIIAELCQEDWPTYDIASKEMDKLTDRLPYRALTIGSMGGMVSLLAASALKNYAIPFLATYCSIMEKQSTKDNVFFASVFVLYILGGVTATKLSYSYNQFWNPAADFNKIRELHVQYQANCNEIEKIAKFI